MKAIILLNNMPETCYECPFGSIYANDKLEEVGCDIMRKRNDKGTSTRKDNCPLIEINDNIAKLIEVAR